MSHLFLRATAPLLLVASAAAQTPVSIVRVGDTIPGVGHVAGIDLVYVDYAGNWTVHVTTDNPAIHAAVLNANGVLRKTGDSVSKPAGATLQSFGAVTDELLLSSLVWTTTLSNTTGGADDYAVYEDLGSSASNLLIQSGGPTSAWTNDFPAGTVWTSFTDYQGPGADGMALLRGTVEDPTLPTIDESFVARSVHAYFGILCCMLLVAEEGRPAPGLAETIERVRLEPWAAVTDVFTNSPLLWSCDISGPTNADGCVFRNSKVQGGYADTLLAREGMPSPVPGRNWGALDAPSLDMNEIGKWSLRAELDASDPATDGIIVRSGVKFVQEGDTHPEITPFVLDDLGRGRALLQSDGKLLWYAHWNDPSGPAEALMLEQKMVVRAGVTSSGGGTIVDLASDAHAFAMSRSGQYVVFQGAREGGGEEAFLLDLGGMSVYCTSKPTSQYCFPSISWSGSLPSATDGSGFIVRTYGVPGPAKGLFLYGTNGPAGLPFHHNTLCVAAPIRRVNPQIAGGTGTCFGELRVDFNVWIASGFDPALVAGQWVHSQFWFRDPGYAPPYDFGLTKGLEFYILP